MKCSLQFLISTFSFVNVIECTISRHVDYCHYYPTHPFCLNNCLGYPNITDLKVEGKFSLTKSDIVTITDSLNKLRVQATKRLSYEFDNYPCNSVNTCPFPKAFPNINAVVSLKFMNSA